MSRRVITMAAVGLVLWCGPWRAGSAPPAEPQVKAPPLLCDLFHGRVKIVDLTWPLNDRSPYWPGEDYEPFKLRTIATIEEQGVLSKAFSMPEHYGTHLDAPNHFVKDRAAVDEIPPQDLFAPGVTIDVTPQVEQDADYELSLEDVQAWEKEHGRIPNGAVVMLRTGWGRHWDRPARYRNQDMRGRMHFPGYSAEASRWLVEKRDVRGLGIDALSIDRGLSRDFAVHKIVNGAGRYGLENVAHLDQLPPRGYYLIVAPIKIETGSGGPTRLFALLP